MSYRSSDVPEIATFLEGVGKAVDDRMKQWDIDQAEAADLCNVSQATIHAVVYGKVVSLATLERVFKGLELTLDPLWAGPPEPTKKHAMVRSVRLNDDNRTISVTAELKLTMDTMVEVGQWVEVQ